MSCWSRKCSKIFSILPQVLALGCQKSLMIRLYSLLTGSSYQTDTIKLILYKQQAAKKGCTTAAKTVGFTEVSTFLMAWKWWSSWVQLFAERSLSRIHSLCVFPFAGDINCSTTWDKGAAEPLSMPPASWHCQTPSGRSALGQTGPRWVHLEKLLCKLPPHSFIICPSLCKVLNVPAIQIALRSSRRGTQEMGERRDNSPCFCRQKNSVICPYGHTELGNHPFSPQLEKDHTGSCCRDAAVSIPLEHIRLTASSTTLQGCEAAHPFSQGQTDCPGDKIPFW